MNTQQLKSFVSVAENLSFSKAAEQLYISIPSISRNIKLIEEELGAVLFVRDKHRVQLTKAGQSFYKDARLILKAHEQAIVHIQEGNRSSQLRICFTSYEELRTVAEVLRRYREQYPEISVRIKCEHYPKSISLLKLQDVDLMLGSENMAPREQDIRFQAFRRYNYIAVVPKNDPLAQKDRLSIEEDLEHRTIVHLPELMIPSNPQNRIKDLLAGHHRHADDIECNDDLICITFASAGYGIAILPEYKIPKQLDNCVCLNVAENESFEYGILTNINDCPQTATDFIRIMKDVFG